jgi:hypothetical protein
MVPTNIAESPKLLSTTFADSSKVIDHSALVIKLRPSALSTSKPRYAKKAAIRPKTTSDESPPLVTTPRKTLSERRGSVEILRGLGIKVAVILSKFSGY